MSPEELLDEDRRLVWHPYSQHGLGRAPIPIRGASGAYVEMADGCKLLDAISSWWVNIHGHGHPAISEAISRQTQQLDHILFAGFTHEPAVALARKLVTLAQRSAPALERVFYSDNGSTAVEVALKIAFQFHHNQGNRDRTRFLALRGSYHGDTLGAMAVAEPEGFHRLFRPLLPQVDFIEPGNLVELRRLLTSQSPSPYAAFIFEPLIQGASGMRTYPAQFLREAVDLCQNSGILTIADEVFTGFYRTGTCFAFEQATIHPDLLCVSKGITGGFLPLGATLATAEIFEAFKGSEIRSAFLHGHSYTANPISCAAANANLDLLETAACQNRIQELVHLTRRAIDRLANHQRVRHARSLGTIGAIDIASTGDYFAQAPDELVHRAMAQGVLLRPMGPVLYAVPPYCVTDAELNKIYLIMEGLLND